MRMDNCPELVSLTLAQWAEEHGVILGIYQARQTNAECLYRTVQPNIQNRNTGFYLFRTRNEAREITERWLVEYNGERPHESLNNLAPEEYRLMAETPEISKSVWS